MNLSRRNFHSFHIVSTIIAAKWVPSPDPNDYGEFKNSGLPAVRESWDRLLGLNTEELKARLLPSP